MADPTGPSDITRKVLDRLRPVAEQTEAAAVTSATADFHARFQALPPELQDHVVSFLQGLDPLPTRCTRLLPQQHWRQMLSDGRTLPFLWDLDADMVDNYRRWRRADGEGGVRDGAGVGGKGKGDASGNRYGNESGSSATAEKTLFAPSAAAAPGPGEEEVEIDFEYLVRMLSQSMSREPPCDEYGGGEREPEPEPYVGFPRELRNRRRIWQLVEEMFVGDVLPVARRRGWGPPPPPPTVPRYWHEDGRPAHPVIRVLGIMQE